MSFAQTSADRIPLQRSTPRYQPHAPFPAYRYLPGVDPHPRRDAAGHSREAAEPHLPSSWEPDNWLALSPWLRGVDLFNAFYFWEAHEAWESLWAVKPKDSAPALLLQGLIQVAAALLKIRLGSVTGAAHLSQTGLAKIAAVAAEHPVYLGLDLHRVVNDLSNYFRPLSERTLPPIDASVPVLTLSGADRT